MKFLKISNIGSDIKYCSEKKLDRVYYSILGGELHTQMRLRPLLNFIQNEKKIRENPSILELGCGFGINAFEIAKVSRNFEYDGFDLNEESILNGKRVVQKKNLQKNIRLFCANATEYCFSPGKKYDFILLIDFLEHIDDPAKILSELNKLTHKDTIFIVSVPTHNYKIYFGEAFHEKIGHVRDGYSLAELNAIFSVIGYENIFNEYSTGFPARYLCSLYYKINFNNRYLNLLKNSLLGRLSFLDFLNDEKQSCSLFAVYKMKLK